MVWGLCKTLRSLGQYQGDLLVLTKDTKYHSYPGITPIYLKHPIPDGPTRKQVCEGLKFTAWDEILATGHDQYLYLDCDIIVVNPIAPLLKQSENIQFCRQVLGHTGTLNSQCFIDDLTPDEIEKYGNQPGWNSGTFIAEPRHTDELNLIADGIRAGKPDQPYLNALAIRGQVKVDPIPDHYMFFYLDSAHSKSFYRLYYRRQLKPTYILEHHITQVDKRGTWYNRLYKLKMQINRAKRK